MDMDMGTDMEMETYTEVDLCVDMRMRKWREG